MIKIFFTFIFINSLFAQRIQDYKIINVEHADSTYQPAKIISKEKFSLITDEINNKNFTKKDLNYSDYRYSGNFFTLFPFGFLRDYGSIGQPNEALLYGQGYNNLSILYDGILQNNRLFNSLDLNLLQTENIDKIEIIPLPRGFLFGINPAAVNFISNDSISFPSYSRVRFYQAPNEEGMIDAIFSFKPAKHLQFYTEITNQSTDPFYRNSDYSLWQANIKVKYKFSDQLLFTGNYYYTKTNVQLNGGVNTDSIKNTYPDEEFNNILYNNILAPVRFYTRYQKVTLNNFCFRLTGELIKNFNSDLAVYYQNNLNEFRQNDTTGINYQTNVENIFHNNEHKTLGIRLKQNLNFSSLKLSFINDFEKNYFYTPLLDNKKNINVFSSNAILSFSFPNRMGVVSAFGKYLLYDKISCFGLGSDLSFNIAHNFKIYFGTSLFQKPFNLFEQKDLSTYTSNNKQLNKTIELKTGYSNSNIKIDIGYFYSSISDKPIPAIKLSEPLSYDEAIYFKLNRIILKGINLSLNLKLWKLFISSNSNYYYSSDAIKTFGIPEFTIAGGIYFVDTLFNSNLFLKAGFNYYVYGKRNSLYTDFEKNISSTYRWIFSPNIRSIPFIPENIYSSESQLDFFISGEIKKRAIIYFVIENFMNRKYFIIPYYPKQERGIRLGVAWEFFD